jgi:hypothetical protein
VRATGPGLLVLLLAVAASVAVFLVVLGGDEPPPDAAPEGERDAVAVASAEPLDPEAHLLRPADGTAEPPTDGVDPSTGAAAQADVRFVLADGSPVGRVRASYGPEDSEDAPLQGTADDQGRLKLHADVVGRRLLLDVKAGPRWGSERFQVWAVGSTPVTLSPGCQVWLTLTEGDADLVGRRCAFRVDGVEQRVEARAARTLLGTFRGSVFELQELGGVPSAGVPLLLPASGSVDLPWQGLQRARVRFVAPAGAAELPRVNVVAEGMRVETPTPAEQGDGWVEFFVPDLGRYVYLAACGNQWALGRFDPQPPEKTVLPPVWERGCRLEALLPDPGPVLWARAYVVSEPGRDVHPGDDAATLDHTRILQQPETDWMDLGAERAGPEHRRWPTEADVSRSRIVWRCVPRGRVVRLFVAGTKHGTISQDVTVPKESENLLVSLYRTTSFTIDVRGQRSRQPGSEEWLTVRAEGEHACECTVLLPRTQHRVVVRGFPLGAQVRLLVQGGGVRGEAEAQVTGEIVVPLTLRLLPSATYRARVVDASGAPVPGVGVRFSSGESGHPEVRTNASGIAAVERTTDSSVHAEVIDERLASEAVEVPPDGTASLEAVPRHVVRVELHVGTREVQVSVGGVFARRYRAVPGSVYERAVAGREPIPVSVLDEEGRVLFAQTLDRSGPSPLHVRVAR